MKKIILSTFTILTITSGVNAQNVTIPDANFKANLVGNSAINTNSDTEIQVSEAAAFTGNIFGNNLGITDLTGIEAFTSLTGLYIRDNNLGAIDISANIALEYIDCQNASLSALDISNNTALYGVSCPINNISILDVSNNTALTAINCSNNNLTSLDLTNTPLLSNFSCDNNDLTSLDLTNNTNLSYFICHFNDLTNLDLSNCPALSYFSCSGNNIGSLDLSNNTVLSTLYCALNNIGYLDVSANTSLQFITCNDNNLNGLNVANGNNINFSSFSATGNPDLSCIEVDDDAWSTTNWTSIDATASFSLDCNYPVAVNELDLSQSVTIYPNPVQSQIHINTDLNIQSVQIIDAFGKINSATLTPNNTLNTSNLSSGIYFLQVFTTDGLVSKKFIKG